jgi:tRNA/rRNA methyltransferase
MKNRYGFILVKPQLGENIGASARSLKNFGFKNFIITSPKYGWPNEKAKATSVGAFDILNNAKVFNNTISAIDNFDIIFSFSARKRDINKKHISMDNFLNIIKRIKQKKIGLMFGPEASGLSNLDLSYSNYVVQIPSSTKFRSMNLSHSVSLVCYEIFKLNNFKLTKQSVFNKEIGQKGKISKILNLLKTNLEKKNFFKPIEKKTSMIKNINNLFYRMQPNDKELRILGSLIGSLSKNKKKLN